MQPCPGVEIRGNTNKDLVAYAIGTREALDKCNAQLGSLRTWLDQQVNTTEEGTENE